MHTFKIHFQNDLAEHFSVLRDLSKCSLSKLVACNGICGCAGYRFTQKMSVELLYWLKMNKYKIGYYGTYTQVIANCYFIIINALNKN